MKKLSYSLLAVLTLLFVAVGCSKSESGDDAASLLATVPADASSVVLVNIAHTVESLGGSTDGSAVKLPDDLLKAIDASEAIKPEDKQSFKEICAGETGIAMSSVVYFSAARDYLTGLLNDPGKFISYLEKRLEAKAEVDGETTMIGRVAVIGNQFWSCPTGRPDIEQLKYYQQLNEQQSYASADAAPLLLEPDKVFTFVADVNRSMALLPNGTYMRMASSLIFNDMAYIAGDAEIKKKNTLAVQANMLNSSMKPAELLLPVEKIDPDVVKSFAKGGDIYIAAGVPKKLTKKLADAVSSILGGESNPVVKGLQAIDGTVAARANSGLTAGEGRIQTTGKNFSDLSFLLQNIPGVRVTRDGDTLTAVYGDSQDFSGYITPEQAADMLKGAWIGVIVHDWMVRDVTAVVKLSEEKKSLRLDFEAEGGVTAIIEAITR